MTNLRELTNEELARLRAPLKHYRGVENMSYELIARGVHHVTFDDTTYLYTDRDLDKEIELRGFNVKEVLDSITLSDDMVKQYYKEFEERILNDMLLKYKSSTGKHPGE